jgi:hypothetical protein
MGAGTEAKEMVQECRLGGSEVGWGKDTPSETESTGGHDEEEDEDED